MYANNSDRAERLEIQIAANGQPYKRLMSVKNATFSTDDLGFATATWSLERDFNASWYDLPINSPIRIVPQYADWAGTVAWEGFLSSVEPVIDRTKASIVLTALGRSAHNDDLYLYATDPSLPPILGGTTGDTPENLLKYLLSHGYLANLSSDTTKLITTGLTGKFYQTANGGTSEESVGAILQAICGWGTSITGQRVLPQVFENGVLRTVALPVTPTPRYRISRSVIDTLGLSRNVMNVANRIIVKYSLNGVADRVLLNDTDSQNAFGTYWPILSNTFNATNFVPFVRTHLVDITGLGYLPDNSLATNIGNLILNQLKRLPNEASQAIVIKKDFVVYDLIANTTIANWQIRPGNWFEVPDLYITNPLEFGTNTVLNYTNLFYMSKFEYALDTGYPQITPEKSSDLVDQLAQVGSSASTNAGMGGYY